MMSACIAKERGIGRGSVHNSSPTQVLERSRKLSKDEMILRLGDGKAVAAKAMGCLRLVVSSHIRIDFKDVILCQSNLIMTAQHKRKLDNHENAQIWNARLGHISKDRIRRLVDSKSLEIDNLDHLPTCESCLKGKMTKKPFVGQSAIANVYLVRYKSEAFERFKEYRLEVENQTNRKIKALRSDQGGEYISGEFIDYLKENGILSQLTPPGTPQLNRVAERRNRTLLDIVRCMMRFTELPPVLLGYALEMVAKLLNIAPSKSVPQTPYEIWGKPACPTSSSDIRKKLRDITYDPAEQKIFVSRNTVFLEKGFPSDSRHDEVQIRRLTSQLDNDPKTYGEAMSDIDSDKWLETMKSEMDSMGSNQVWTLVDPPKGARPVRCKWVYKRKLGADGEVTAFKARLVAKGYTQRPGVDFEETYSPVAMVKSIWILLAIAACRRVSLLLKKNRRSVISKVPSTASSKLPEAGTRVLMKSYGVMISSRTSDIKAWLSTQFFMKDMGKASYILGIKIYRDRSRKLLGLTQSSYIEKVLKRFKMEDSKRGLFPMRHGIKLSKKQSPKTDEELKRMSNIPYASAVGSIQHASWRRAGAVKSILKYLKRTKDMFLIYGGSELILEGYSDASFQSDDDDAKSQSASEAAKEAIWMKNYIQELGVVPSIAEPVVIFCDNNGAIAQAKEPRSHHRSKNILRRYHLLREMVSRDDCRMDRVSSAENTTDPLTKPMSQIVILNLDKMGLRSMGDWL
ncbi:UNVERIFIED_CONTAM: Retrovirus-related Pol polyprotein from transposon TNT 1-94 [Sesamum latifolium]|uniref:Retrovirus-related Pol polyprotein from transposon TNT 1-94 n=1 Tax=Sesamum latifolium TaxID=2727402 RepID=A0AAW2XUE7_9LAMI